MRISKIRTIWITTFSILTMLISSFAFSTPLMTFQQHSQHHAPSTKSVSNQPCSAHEHSQIMDNSTHHAGNDCCLSTNIHTSSAQFSNAKVSDCHSNSCGISCCGAYCPVTLAIIDEHSLNAPQHHLLEPWPQVALIHLASQTKSLYRPPIA